MPEKGQPQDTMILVMGTYELKYPVRMSPDDLAHKVKRVVKDVIQEAGTEVVAEHYGWPKSTRRYWTIRKRIDLWRFWKTRGKDE